MHRLNGYSLARSLLFQWDAEKSHYFALNLLKWGLPSWIGKKIIERFPSCPVRVFNMTFPNPVGLAAGFDKNGDYIDPLLSLGFGFVELGTVTPLPQGGNPKPRLFRLPKASAIINRMGFNNFGVNHLIEKIQTRRLPGIIGANLGKNSHTPLEKAAEDYCLCLRRVYPFVNYVTINISSPNTPALRQLQSSSYLHDLLIELDQTQNELINSGLTKIPLLIKIDPDMTDKALEELVNTITQHQVDGIIATNTTINHQEVEDLPYGKETGGLSGRPLFQLSTQVIYKLHHLLGGQLPIIASGGIFSPQDAVEKLAAGAKLVQIYTGLIYQGPALIRHIVKYLIRETIPSFEEGN